MIEHGTSINEQQNDDEKTGVSYFFKILRRHMEVGALVSFVCRKGDEFPLKDK